MSDEEVIFWDDPPVAGAVYEVTPAMRRWYRKNFRSQTIGNVTISVARKHPKYWWTFWRR